MSMTARQLIDAERHRQIETEGYDDEHDAGHQLQLMAAAETYYDHAIRERDGRPLDVVIVDGVTVPPATWPWLPVYWKPASIRRTLVKAGALAQAGAIAAINEGDSNTEEACISLRDRVAEALQQILDAEEDERPIAPATGFKP